MNEEKLQSELEPALNEGADVIVLACTHYHWIQEQILKLAAGRAEVIQPEEAVVRQLKRVLGLQP
jgi:glutamate racemase